jgi:hypothetical protein
MADAPPVVDTVLPEELPEELPEGLPDGLPVAVTPAPTMVEPDTTKIPPTTLLGLLVSMPAPPAAEANWSIVSPDLLRS